jgi:hypothetical protein
MNGPTKPHVDSNSLIGVDGNAYFIMAHVANVLRRAGASSEYIDTYREEAISGDYDNLLVVSMLWLDKTADGPQDAV